MSKKKMSREQEKAMFAKMYKQHSANYANQRKKPTRHVEGRNIQRKPSYSSYNPPSRNVNAFDEKYKQKGYTQTGEQYERILDKNEAENSHIFVRRWNGVIEVIDKKTKKRVSLYNHSDDKADNAIRHGCEVFNDDTTQQGLINEIEEKNNHLYHSTLYRSEGEVKKIPKLKVTNEDELEQRYKEIPDKKINVRIKNKDSWNTVPRTRIPLVLKHSTVKCNGLYTDDYAFDDATNYGKNASSNDCKIRILNDVQSNPESHDYIKLYWDNPDKEFIIYYGQWLSYSAKPDKNLKLNFR